MSGYSASAHNDYLDPDRHDLRPDEGDDIPESWTVVWDYIGGDCGDLPWRFYTEAEAIACGEEWVADTLADMRMDGDDTEEGFDGRPVYHIVHHEGEEV